MRRRLSWTSAFAAIWFFAAASTSEALAQTPKAKAQKAPEALFHFIDISLAQKKDRATALKKYELLVFAAIAALGIMVWLVHRIRARNSARSATADQPH